MSRIGICSNACQHAGQTSIFLVQIILFKVKKYSFFIYLKTVNLVIDKVREMSYGLPNMSEMLTYADQEVKDLAAERRIKRRADFEKKSNTGAPPSKMQKTEENRFVKSSLNNSNRFQSKSK